jgi:hypothetical protein
VLAAVMVPMACLSVWACRWGHFGVGGPACCVGVFLAVAFLVAIAVPPPPDGASSRVAPSSSGVAAHSAAVEFGTGTVGDDARGRSRFALC